jgi:predicted RNA-binding protein YlqC (UPF0109 family)
MKRQIIRLLANKGLCDRLQKQGCIKEATICEYELNFEKGNMERIIGRELSYGNLRKFLRKCRW